MMRLANGLLHGLHVALILFTLMGWILPETRTLHRVACLATLCSWFVIGPLIDRPGFCLLTGMQHWVWGKQGREHRPNYMAFLFQRITGQQPGAGRERSIDGLTQTSLYLCTLLSFCLD